MPSCELFGEKSGIFLFFKVAKTSSAMKTTAREIPTYIEAVLAVNAVIKGSNSSWNFSSVRLPLLEMEKMGRRTSVG